LFPLGHADYGMPLLHASIMPALHFLAACYFCSMISMSYRANANDCCSYAASIVPIGLHCFGAFCIIVVQSCIVLVHVLAMLPACYIGAMLPCMPVYYLYVAIYAKGIYSFNYVK
jgi:hypothetical protein